jgi:uncharacterized circularly permuted ATP-grasp superfamily protein
VVPVEGVPELLHTMLQAAMPPKASTEGTIALLSAGPVDSAWYEHQLLATNMDTPLVLKPVDGYGGSGIVIGPLATSEELDEVARAATSSTNRHL